MKIALDTETTTKNNGDPFDWTNHLVVGGYGTDTTCSIFNSTNPDALTNTLQQTTLLILFNGKFDLHWLRRIGVRFSHRLPIWDCQLAEFILANQRLPYPALEEAAIKYGLGNKIDVIKLKYWNNGIDTDQIPIGELTDYLKQDVSLTYKLYLKQVEEFKKPEHSSKLKVFRLCCYDLLVLEEMEWNGYKFNTEAALRTGKELEDQCTKLDATLQSMYPSIPINFSSNDHISAVLYGGTIKEVIKIPVGTYKTGQKAGEIKYKNSEQEYKLPRLVEPIKGSELAKEGYYSTNEDTLQSLSAKGLAKKTIELLLERRGLEKLRGTYYEGIPKLISNHNWEKDMVHGNLNQCVTNTGRLSATKPNQQNMPPTCKQFCITRY